MNQHARKRKKVWVQQPIQGGLAFRCTLYWFFCLCTIFLFVAIGTTFSGDLKTAGEMFLGIWQQYSPAVLASVLLLPFVVWDVINFSHRVVGPIVRLEKEMARLARGETVAPLTFRKNDFWPSLAEQFNQVALAQERLRSKATVSAPPNSPFVEQHEPDVCVDMDQHQMV